MKIKPLHIVGVVVIIAALLFGASAFQSSLTPYISIAEAKAAKGQVQVSGLVKAGTAAYDAANHFTFTLTDDQGNTLPVVYKRIKPANFDDAIGVVAVGHFKDGALEADQLLVKCPSKYEAQYGPTKAPNQ